MRQFLYDCSIGLGQLGMRVIAPFHPKTKRWLAGQSGLVSKLLSESKGLNNPIWIHCASLGEFEQGRPLIEKIKEANAEQQIVLTFFSPSGYEIRKDYARADRVFYLPLDSRANAAAFLDAVKPVLAVFVKYEVWPNYLSGLKARNIPSVLISAKFNEGARYFSAGGGFIREALFKFDHIFVQDESTKVVLEKAGYQKTSVAGDTRIDRVIESAREPEANAVVDSFAKGAPTIVAGSTWEKDEQLLFELIQAQPELKLVLAPHEIGESHLSKVASLFGPLLVGYSDLLKGQALKDERVLLIDNIGMLASLYQYGYCAYIGGGFGEGIHNVLEAAVYGIPVIFGPKNKRFREAQDLKELGVGLEINNVEGLHRAATTALSSKNREEAREKLKTYFQKEKGATEMIYAFLKSLIPSLL